MRRFTDAVREQLAQWNPLLDQYESFVGEWEDRQRRYAEQVHGHEVLFQTTRQQTALHIASVQAAALSARIVGLGNGLTAVTNARNAHSIPVVARALFESCAIPFYMRRNVVPRLQKGKTERVHALLYRLGLNTRMTTPLHVWKPLDVASLINAMTRDVDDAVGEMDEEDVQLLGEVGFTSYGDALRLSYAYLCEFTHPNQAAMTISTGTDAVGHTTWTLQPDLDVTTVVYGLRPAWLALGVGGVAVDEVMTAFADYPMPLPDRVPTFHESELRDLPDGPTDA